MGIFSALMPVSVTLDKPNNILSSSFGGSANMSGMVVTPDTALNVATVLTCVKVVSEDLAKLPLILYKADGNGSRERQKQHPLYKLLRRKPNRFQTAFIFKSFLESQVKLEGNG
jgi:phage portal protein BeeE